MRPAAVAGQFYDGDSSRLKDDVDALLSAAATDAPCPKVLVAPHAGYVYSGPVAAEVYARLANARQPISRVVLLGPSHRVGFRGIALSSVEAFTTPLGNIPLDHDALAQIAAFPGVHERDEAHALEHSLEVHLPFLQCSLGEFRLVPLVVGDATPDQVAAVLEALWGGPETLLVISSDLSHFLPYSEARARDTRTAQRIESLQANLSGDEACGCRPLNGLLTLLARRGLGIQRVAIRNSGDTAGDRSRVVGYGAWVVNEPPIGPGEERLGFSQRQQLLQLARNAIARELSGVADFDVPLAHYDGRLQQKRGSFVTLHLQNRLRGCVGNLSANRALLLDVAHNARAAAFRDPRFKPLSNAEYPNVELHISVLGPARPLPVASRQELLDLLEPGRHGLILEEAGKRSTFLPSVWEQLPEPDRFVGELRAKAGLPRDGWTAGTRVSAYTTEEFS